MITTYFRPSIHGWPFGNSWRKSFAFDTVTLDMGFCGGMCWRALQRFYNAIPINRNTPQPPEGDALYNEIWDAQVDSVPSSTLWKIYRWQESPDLSHWNRKHSQGHMTQEEWPSVKDKLDRSEPVTLTLIAHSNDVNLTHLADSHRVVAYAYEERGIIQGEGEPDGADSHVTIFIYDPNEENDDEVYLTFYLGGDKSKIRLRHNKKGGQYHGFFLDDKDRSYANPNGTMVRIDKCEQTGISSATLADYDLGFSWQCRFIPYFCIQVDGTDWKYNSALQLTYDPKIKPDGTPFNNKQCTTRMGSITVNLKLPRALSTVTVRLLGADDYYQSVAVDASPAIYCYPYVQSRASDDGSQVSDTGISDADLFIKDPNPTQAAVQQLNTSPFRWIMLCPKSIDTRGGGPRELSTAHIAIVDQYRLGNIAVPILAKFVEKNLAAPTRTSGILTINRGSTVQTTNLPTLDMQAQKIFNGFTDNPADYDNDTTVELTYKSIDRFNRAAEGQVVFYGQSIIYQKSTVTISIFDPAKVGRLEVYARYLIERGLIDITVDLPQAPGAPGRGRTPFPPQPRPTTINPVILLAKLHAHRQLQGLIDQTLKELWSKTDIWKEIWKVQSEILKQDDQDSMIHIDKIANFSETLKAAQELKDAMQRKYDGVIIYTFTEKAIEQLKRNQTVIDKLKKLL